MFGYESLYILEKHGIWKLELWEIVVVLLSLIVALHLVTSVQGLYKQLFQIWHSVKPNS